MDSTPVAPTQTLDVIERSLQKTYHNSIFVKFVKAIEEYHLLEPNDKIAVCISGGKDSLLLAKLFQELKKHNKFPFELEFISMDPGFTPNNLASLKLNCQHLNIDLKIFESHIFEIVQKVASDNPCYLCSKMRRGFLYKTASSLGCNKIALAHHFNDVIETTLLNVLYGSEFKTMVPKLTSDNFDNMTLIRPLFLVKEYDIQKWKTYCGISSMDCGCVVKAKKTASKRAEMKELIASLKEINPNVDKNIFISSKNINLDAVLGYKINGEFTDYESIFSRNLNVRNKH
jgi:tRNA(Ile)-lysidine synthase TilS/MesJ